MATLADVAALADVSKATASRALSRPELVAPATLQRVRDVAERLGFVPNRAARELANGRTGIVALVVPTLENTFFTPIIDGAQRRAAEADLQLTVAVLPLEDASALVAFERLAGQVDGFIVAAPRGGDGLVRSACGFKPSVLVDREVAGLTSVAADTARAFGTLVARLIEDGHHRLAYIGGPDGSWQDAQRAAAVRAAASAGVARLSVLGPYPATFASGVEAAGAVVESAATAVVPYATAIGLGVMFGLNSRGITTPGDVTVSLERSVVQALGITDAPAIDVDGVQLGWVAMERLVHAIDARAGHEGAVDEGTQLRLPVAVQWAP